MQFLIKDCMEVVNSLEHLVESLPPYFEDFRNVGEFRKDRTIDLVNEAKIALSNSLEDEATEAQVSMAQTVSRRHTILLSDLDAVRIRYARAVESAYQYNDRAKLNELFSYFKLQGEGK